MKTIKHTVAQLLVLADMAAHDESRPHIEQVYWSPDWVAATNGHRMLLVSMPHDHQRNVGLAATSLRRWLAGPGRAKSETCEIALDLGTYPNQPPGLPRTRLVLTTSGGGPLEQVRLPAPPGDCTFPEAMKVFPDACFVNGRPQMPPVEARIVTPHVIAPTYLEGVSRIADAFHLNVNGLELLAAPSALDPILYGATTHDVENIDGDGIVFYLVMPMRPSWSVRGEAVR